MNLSKEFQPVNKPKNVKHKREIVKKHVYEQVYERDGGRFRLCGAGNIQLHHIDGRGKDLTNDINNCIMLCTQCHQIVHSNKHKWQPKLKELINKG